MPSPDPGYPSFGGGSAWEREETIWTIWADMMLHYLQGVAAKDTGADVGLIEGLTD